MAHAATMRAVAIREPGGPEVLEIEDRPIPVARRGRGADRRRRRRRQPPRRHAAERASIRRRPALPTFPAWRFPAWWRGSARASPASRRATRSSRWCRAAATPNIAPLRKQRRCRFPSRSRWWKAPAFRRRPSPSGTTSSSAAGSGRASGCSSMAGRAASARRRSSSPRRSAPSSSRPPARTRNARRSSGSAPMPRSTTRPPISSRR